MRQISSFSKRLTASLVAGTCLLLASSLTHAEDTSDGFTISFSKAPYSVEEPVVGRDGWYAVGPLTKSQPNPQDPPLVAIAAIPEEPTKTGLSLKTYGIERLTQAPLKHRVQLSAVIHINDGNRDSLRLAPLLGSRVDHLVD